jgi:hypothetical protein
LERRSGVRELSYWTILSPGLLGMGPWPLAFGAVPVQLAQVVRGAGESCVRQGGVPTGPVMGVAQAHRAATA